MNEKQILEAERVAREKYTAGAKYTVLDVAQALGYEEGVDLEPHGSVDLLEVAELEEAQALEWLKARTNFINEERTCAAFCECECHKN